jgi:hypothetical protein
MLDLRMTCDRMMVEENINAPNMDPKGINAVSSESLFPAIIAVSTSGAPFANARKVTPASVSPISELSHLN